MKKYIPILILSIILIMSITCNASELKVSELMASEFNIIGPGLREVVLTPPFSEGMNLRRNIFELDDTYGPDWVNGVAHSAAFAPNSMDIYACGIQISLPNPERTYIKSVNFRITYDMYAWAQKGDPAISKWDVFISSYDNGYGVLRPDDITDIIPRNDPDSRIWCHYSEEAISGSKKYSTHKTYTRRYTVGAPAVTPYNNYTGIRLWAWARAEAGSDPRHSGAGCRVIAEIESIKIGVRD